MGDLTGLTEAKEWLSITTDGSDILLDRLISAASAFIQGPEGIGYEVASQAYAEVRDGHGGSRLAFGRPPLTAVASVKVDGVEIPPAAAVLGAGYRFSAGLIWLNGYLFTRGAGNVEVACTRGWAATPPQLEQACIELVAWRYSERERIGQESKSIQGANVTFSTKDIPADVQRVLQAWKKVAPV